MLEYSFFREMVEEIEGFTKINSKTLEYRYDKFVEACGMSLEDSKPVKCTGDSGTLYISKTKDNDEKKYNINFCLNYDYKNGRSTVLMGLYDDLNMVFINYCDTDKNKNVINEIPFQLKLGKVYQGIYHEIEIIGKPKELTKFIIKKNRGGDISDSLTFYINLSDFGLIIRLVKSFVTDPETIYEHFNGIMNKKKVTLTYNDLENGIIKDNNLNEPVKGIKKLMRKILN